MTMSVLKQTTSTSIRNFKHHFFWDSHLTLVLVSLFLFVCLFFLFDCFFVFCFVVFFWFSMFLQSTWVGRDPFWHSLPLISEDMIGPSPWQAGRGKYWLLHTCTHTWSLPACRHGDHNSRRGICLLTYSPCRSYQCAGITDTLFVDYYRLTDITEQNSGWRFSLSLLHFFSLSLFISLSLCAGPHP